MASSRSWRPTPLGAVLCVVFLLITQALAAPAVLGVDLGTEYIKAVLVKPGTPLEVILTKDSRRKELAAIAFKPPKHTLNDGEYPERVYGSDAVALAPRFPADVYPNLKKLLGLRMEDEVVQEYSLRHPALQIQEDVTRRTPIFRSTALSDGEQPWTVEELLAMQLQSIRKNAEATAGPDSSIKSIVVTVPPFYTAEEKRAVQVAAELSGLKVLSLVSDGVAVGVHYATSRQFPNINEGGKPEHHLVFDMGAGSTKATVMRFQSRSVKDVGRFNKTVQEVQVLGASWDRTLGGDAFNGLIIDDMVSQFVASKSSQSAGLTASGIKSHGRAMATLTKEAERLRQILSANSNTHGNFESLYEDVDFKYAISRADFEKMAETHAARVAEVVRDALKASQLDFNDLSSVILHGGASRTPFVQKALEGAVGSADKIRTNVNSDEAAVMGAGFRAADLSPGFRVKEIRISEGAGYPTGLRWSSSPEQKEQKEHRQRLWSAISPIGGPAKEITFPNTDELVVEFYQTVAGEDVDVKQVKTTNLTATVTELREKHGCAEGSIVVRAGFKLLEKDGEVGVDKFVAECETEGKDGLMDGVKNLFGFGKKDQVPLRDDDEASSAEASESPSASSSPSPAPSSAETGPDDAPKLRTVSIPIKYTVTKTGILELSTKQIEASKARLRAFNTSDRNRRVREEVLNQLEAFAYSIRDLLENKRFIAASTDEERAQLETQSNDASEWLYGDGADAPKGELKKRLDDLNAIAGPIQKRMKEADERPTLLSGLKQTLNQTASFLGSMRKQAEEYDAWHSSASASASSASSAAAAGSYSTAATPSPSPDDEFDGLEDRPSDPPEGTEQEKSIDDIIMEQGPVPPLYTGADLDEMEKALVETKGWLEELEAKQDALPATADPVLLSKELKDKKDKLEKLSLDLALRGMRSFESKARKMTKDSESKQLKSKRADKPKQEATKVPKEPKMPKEDPQPESQNTEKDEL